MRAFIMIAACSVLAGCPSFTVDRTIPEQRVEGSLVSQLLGTFFEDPIPLAVDISQETQARDTGPAKRATLDALQFRVTDSARPSGDDDDFDFLSSIVIDVRSSDPGSALPAITVAELPDVPRDAQLLELETRDVDLLPYVEEGAVFDARVKGSVPPDDVTFDGSYSICIEL